MMIMMAIGNDQTRQILPLCYDRKHRNRIDSFMPPTRD